MAVQIQTSEVSVSAVCPAEDATEECVPNLVSARQSQCVFGQQGLNYHVAWFTAC